MRPIFKSVIAAGALLLSGHSMAGTVSVEWVSPEKYTDIEAVRGNQSSFNQTVFYQFEKQFKRLAQDLPEGHHWQVSVKDVNLMGEVRPKKSAGMGQDRFTELYHRTVKQNRFVLSWQVTDAQGNVIAKADDQVIKYKQTWRKRNVTLNPRPFTTEKYLLKNWFYKEMVPQLHAASGASGQTKTLSA